MSTLYIVPTPIGNVGDITIRAKEVLNIVTVILSEDTRVTKKLLNLLEIDYKKGKKFVSYYEHNELQRNPEVIAALQDGIDIALVSDAGTPIISDPGYKLVREIREKYNDEISIAVLPGATSITTALVASGFAPDKFTFLGYFPRKVSERKKLCTSIKNSRDIKVTYIAFETQHRIVKTLEAIKGELGENVSVALCQELTKKFERVSTGTVLEILEQIKSKQINLKGEMVLIFRTHIDRIGVDL